MVPNLKKGSSFRGAMLYYLHDKRQEGEFLRLSEERVAWTATRNCAANDPELAFQEMSATAWDAERLKADGRRAAVGTPAGKAGYDHLALLASERETQQGRDGEGGRQLPPLHGL